MSIEPSNINANGDNGGNGGIFNFIHAGQGHVNTISVTVPAVASQKGRKQMLCTSEKPTMSAPAPAPQKNEGNTLGMHPPGKHPLSRKNGDQTLPQGPGGNPLFPSYALRRDKHEMSEKYIGMQHCDLWPYLFPGTTMNPSSIDHKNKLRERLVKIHSDIKRKGNDIARQYLIQRCNDESLCINGGTFTEMKHVHEFFSASNKEVVKVLQAQPRALINLLDRLFVSQWGHNEIESWLFPGIISWFKAPKIGAVDYRFEINPLDCDGEKSKRSRHVVFRVAIMGAYKVLEGLMNRLLTSYGFCLQRTVITQRSKKQKNNLCLLLRGGNESTENKLYLIISLKRHPLLTEDDRNLSAEEALNKLSPSMADYYACMLAISARQEFSVNSACAGALKSLEQAMELTRPIIKVSVEQEHEMLSGAAKIMSLSGVQGKKSDPYFSRSSSLTHDNGHNINMLGATHQPNNVVHHHATAAVVNANACLTHDNGHNINMLGATHQPNNVVHHHATAANANANLARIINQHHQQLAKPCNSVHQGAFSAQGQSSHTSFHFDNMGGTQNSGVQFNQMNAHQDEHHSLIGGTQDSDSRSRQDKGAFSAQGQSSHTSFHFDNMGGTQNSGVQFNQMNAHQDEHHSLIGGTQDSDSRSRQDKIHSLSNSPNQGSDSDSDSDFDSLFGNKLRSITDPIDSASTNEKGG
jgi:hypothetical protein